MAPAVFLSFIEFYVGLFFRLDLKLYRLPDRAQLFYLYPFVDIGHVQFVPHGLDNGTDITDMFGLLADAVVQQFVDDQVFGCMKIQLTQSGTQVDQHPPSEGFFPEGVPFPQKVQVRFVAA